MYKFVQNVITITSGGMHKVQMIKKFNENDTMYMFPDSHFCEGEFSLKCAHSLHFHKETYENFVPQKLHDTHCWSP